MRRLFFLHFPTKKISLMLLLYVTLIAAGCSGVLLDERFHDSRLDNWRVIDEQDTVEAPSEWRVEQDGWLHQRSNIWGRRGDFLGRWFGTLIVAGDEDWDDYTFSVRAKATDDDGFGLVFRFRDPEHFYRLLFIEDGLNGGPITRLDKREGSDYTELWSAARGYRAGAEMVIEIEAARDLLRGTLDGQFLFEVRDRSYVTGKVGLFCYAQNGQAFDDARVESR
jgi:hypothetical protein